MKWKFVLVSALAVLMVTFSTMAYAQGGATSQLSGTVVDSSGGVMPGADVTVKEKAMGTTYTAVTGANGVFTVPSIPPGTYTVTIALMGFKTAILNDVVVNVNVPANVKAVLELGKFEETVVVEAAAQIVQTQTSAVSSTLNVKQISNLPLPGRGAFDLVTQLPGVSNSDGTSRGSTINGLPQSAVNITLDGMNIQDNYAKTWDGMFTRVSPRLDAVEEVTVNSAASGAGDSGQGAATVRFVTRSGTNQYKGSIYYYLRSDRFNSNTWFNLHRNVDTSGNPTAKPVLAQYQPGGRMGGPIIKDKAFFFVNYEWISSPGTLTLNQTIMSPDSEAGWFTNTAGLRKNVLDLAASKGFTSTIDPTVAKALAFIRSSTSQGKLNATTDPLTQTFSWQQPTKGQTKYPTVRIDYNLTSKHRLTFSLTENHLISDPDTTNSYWSNYPSAPVHGSQDSARYSGQISGRSTLTKNMVNEARFGLTGGATLFFPELKPGMFSDYNGYGLQLSNFKSVNNLYNSSANSSREASTKVIEDTLTWLKGKHSITVNGGLTQADVWLWNQQQAPTISFGIATGDPADSMFTTANFPGASTTDLNNARALYSVLTGRVTAITRNARIAPDGSTFVILGESMQKGRLNEFGFYVQDSWRVRPDLTVNAGLRYELQLPFYAVNNSYSTADMAGIMGVSGTGSGFVPGSTVSGLGNLFKPGVLEGSAPTYQMLTADTHAYNVDKNNLAPSIGAAWTVGSDHGLLHKILGSPGDSVLRAGWNIAYQRPGMNDFTQMFGSNPGISIDASRNQTNGNLGTVPLLLRSGDLNAPSINLSRSYPMPVPNASSSIYAFDPNIKVPYSDTWQVGIQRALTKSMMVEARFIHTGNHGQWTLGNLNNLNYNETNIVENGFLDEFKIAQANLQANIAAGKGQTFAYTGAAGTRPLPIYLAYLNGVPNSQAGDTSKYSGTNWTNTTLVQYLYPLNPTPLTAANALRTNATYKANGLAAKMPSNFFVVNPDVSGAYVAANGPDTRYNGIQLVMNRRFTNGLQMTANYSFGKGYQYTFYGFHKPMVELQQNYSNSGGGSATGPATHVFTANWVYELPFGQGKKWGGNVGRMMNRVIGNWSYSGTALIRSGRMVDFGNVRLVGFTKDDLPGMFQTRMVTDPNNQYRTLVYMLPQDIIDNTIKAFSFSATGYSAGAPTGRYFAPANGPDCMETTNGFGDCGARTVIVTGPRVVRFDMSMIKEVPITRTVAFRFEAMVFNVFNNLNLSPGVYTGATSDSYQITGAVDQSRTMQLAFRITW